MVGVKACLYVSDRDCGFVGDMGVSPQLHALAVCLSGTLKAYSAFGKYSQPWTFSTFSYFTALF
jgi:hypothetical protein